MKKLFIIDGHALCYRAYFAFIKNPLRNSKGQNTSAIFGFARMLFKLISEQKPDYLIVAFDPPTKSFRFEMYPEYKANRQKMPDDLRPQIDEIRNMLSVLNINAIIADNYEADDLLGAISKKYASDKIHVTLVTGDKDAYQLIADNVNIYANKKGIAEFELYDRDAVINKVGVAPEQIVDYMALMGDASDNIPGVSGIGEKTAQKLIAKYGSLDKLYADIDSVDSKKIKETLINEKDMAELSRKLATIKTDIPLDIDLEKTTLHDFKRKEVADYFISLDMKSVVKDIFGDDAPAPEADAPAEKAVEKEYRIIKTEKELEAIIDEIKKKGELSIDTETTSVNPVEAELVGISLSVCCGKGWYIPVRNASLFSEDFIPKEISLKLIKPVIENAHIKKIGQNIKYDMLVLRSEGIHMQGVYFDTMVASYLLDPEAPHNMDDLAETYLNYKTITYEELVGKGKHAIPITEVPLDRLADYAIEDAEITYRLYELFAQKLKEQNLEKLFFDIEMPLVSVLADMEYTGVKIDVSRFKELAMENDRLLFEAEKKIYELAGQRFNINSTKELPAILFDKLGLKPVRKTKTGFSTDIRTLEVLQGQHEIIDHLIKYRTVSKLKNTYIDTLPLLISARSGRIHTSYNQAVAATGRLSSTNPNLQNIPAKDEFGKKIRSAFIAEKDFLLLSADYSQIELRLAAHLSRDENMVKAFNEGIDIHNLTASNVFNVSIDAVTPEMRRQAKVVNFATIYGVSPFGLSQQADISIHDAAIFIKKYFETYPKFKDYIDSTVQFANDNGYVTTLLGRKRFVSDIKADVSFRREGAERIAINTPIQGTAADMIKIAMINIQRIISEKKLKSRMILQVHDELVFEVEKNEKQIMEDIVRREMEGALKLIVPATVDIAWGTNWGEAK